MTDSRAKISHKMGEVVQHQAAISQKLACCSSTDKIDPLLDELIPLYREAHRLCAEALG